MTDSTSNLVQILIAEDNPGDVRLIREALKQHNVHCHLHVVDDGEKALGLIGQLSDPSAVSLDLILLDLNLPKSDGRDILRRIKASPRMQRVPIVILSSSESPHDRVETAELGANCYIRKPSTLDEFLKIGAIAKEFVASA